MFTKVCENTMCKQEIRTLTIDHMCVFHRVRRNARTDSCTTRNKTLTLDGVVNTNTNRLTHN